MAALRATLVVCIQIFLQDKALALKLRNSTSSLTFDNHNVSVQAPRVDLLPGNLVFDFGFYNGADSRSYLTAGFNVVAIEADPTLVAKAEKDKQLSEFMKKGQLKLLNKAIAPAGAQPWTTFYMNKCTKEWNSFYASIGCRSCTAPYHEDPTGAACEKVPVEANTCQAIMQQHGVPQYFKLDIEGAESGCYSALSMLPEMVRPLFISGEVGDAALVDTFHNLGYKSFKLVQQSSGVTGAWGNKARDCRTGELWRSYLGAKAEISAMLTKPAVAGDVCPGSLVGGVWYDMHASRQIPQAW